MNMVLAIQVQKNNSKRSTANSGAPFLIAFNRDVLYNGLVSLVAE